MCRPDKIVGGHFFYDVEILIDNNSIEVNLMNGLSFMTELIFPN